MALTNDRPKETLTTAQLIADLLVAVKPLVDGDIEKLAKQVYSLSETESRKLEEARKNIADYEATIANLKEQQRILAQQNDALDAKKEALDAEREKLATYDKSLKDRSVAVSRGEEQNRDTAKALDALKSQLDSGLAALARDKEALASEKKRVADFDASLKERENKLKALIG